MDAHTQTHTHTHIHTHIERLGVKPIELQQPRTCSTLEPQLENGNIAPFALGFERKFIGHDRYNGIRSDWPARRRQKARYARTSGILALAFITNHNDTFGSQCGAFLSHSTLLLSNVVAITSGDIFRTFNNADDTT